MEEEQRNFFGICTEVDLPLCKFISQVPCSYGGRSYKLGSLTIFSLYTVFLLIVNVLCTVRIIFHIREQHAGIGKAEMTIFLYFYMATIVTDMILISGVLTSAGNLIHTILTALQLTLIATTIFALFVGALTSVLMVKQIRIRSSTLTVGISIMYFIITFLCIFYSLIAKIEEVIFIILFFINGGFICAYVLFKIWFLRSYNSEIWAYGTMFVGLIFAALALTPLFWGCKWIAIYSDRYLDGLFFIHLFFFCAIIMIHKLWLSVCADEAECSMLSILAKQDPLQETVEFTKIK